MYSSIYSQQQIRDFYSSTSFNLHNYFETSKIGEIENLQKQVKRPTDDSVANITSIQIKEIESLLSGNSKNKKRSKRTTQQATPQQTLQPTTTLQSTTPLPQTSPN